MRRRHDNAVGALFVLPAIVLAVLFKVIPLIRGLVLSFYSLQSGEAAQYVGVGNYVKMVESSTVQQTFLNAAKIVLTLPVWVVIPLVLALLIYQRTPGWRAFRAIYFVPYTIAPVIVGEVFRQLLNSAGPLDSLLRTIGLGALAVSWLGDERFALWTLDAVVLWSYFGLGVVTYLAGLGTISEELFDAAAIDGAGFFRRMFRIVIPLIVPVMGYWTILCTSGMLIWMFPFIYSLTEGGPGYATMLPEFWVYLTSFQFSDLGYGTTIGVALFVFVLLFSMIQVRYMFVTGSAGQKGRR